MAKQISKIKEPPTTSDPQNFDARADEFVACLPKFVTEANELAVEAEGNANAAQNSKEAAAASAEQAGQARDAAALSAQNLATAVNDAIECKQSAAKSASNAKKSETAVSEMNEAVKSAKSELENEIEQAKETITNDIEQAKSLINSGNGGVIDDGRVSEVSTYSSKKLEADVLAQFQALEKKYEELKVFAQESNMAYDIQDLIGMAVALTDDEYSKVSSLRFMEDGNIAVLGQNFIKIYTPDLEEVAVPPLPSPQKSLQYIVMTIGEHPTIFVQGNQTYDVYRLIKNSETYIWEKIGREGNDNIFTIGNSLSQECNKFVYARYDKDNSIWKYDNGWQKANLSNQSQISFDGKNLAQYGTLSFYGKDCFYLYKYANGASYDYTKINTKTLEQEGESKRFDPISSSYSNSISLLFPEHFLLKGGDDSSVIIKNLQSNTTRVVPRSISYLSSFWLKTPKKIISLQGNGNFYILGDIPTGSEGFVLKKILVKLNSKFLAKYGI